MGLEDVHFHKCHWLLNEVVVGATALQNLRC